MNTPKLYTVKEAAKLVGVSTNTLYKYLDEGRIKAARGSAIQGRFRIPGSALEEFLGVTLDSPETEPSPSPTSLESQPPVSRESVSLIPPSLPVRAARILLFIALIATLIDLFTARAVSAPSVFARLLTLFILLILVYGQGGYQSKVSL